jgi:hypothetical protein
MLRQVHIEVRINLSIGYMHHIGSVNASSTQRDATIVVQLVYFLVFPVQPCRGVLWIEYLASIVWAVFGVLCLAPLGIYNPSFRTRSRYQHLEKLRRRSYAKCVCRPRPIIADASCWLAVLRPGRSSIEGPRTTRLKAVCSPVLAAAQGHA